MAKHGNITFRESIESEKSRLAVKFLILNVKLIDDVSTLT